MPGDILSYDLVTIASGATGLSASIKLTPSGIPVAIQMPATWVAASLTFQASRDNVVFNNMYDSAGVEYTVTAAAARYIILTPKDFAGVLYVKVRSGTSGTPVDQTAERSIYLVKRET